MFLNLRKGSTIYILDKNGTLTYSQGTIEDLTLPQTKIGTYIPTMDIVVSVNDKKREFKQVPANSNVADGGIDSTVITDSKDEIIKQLQIYDKYVNNVLSNTPTLEENSKICKKILADLSPEYAKETARDKDIESLKTKMNAIEDKFSDIDTKLASIIGHFSKSETIKT